MKNSPLNLEKERLQELSRQQIGAIEGGIHTRHCDTGPFTVSIDLEIEILPGDSPTNGEAKSARDNPSCCKKSC